MPDHLDELYFDHNATSPLLPEVVAALQSLLDRPLGNPASPHPSGVRSRQLLRTARAQVAALIGAADPREVLFTSGGSEANQLALRGLLAGHAPAHVIATSIEHSSVLQALPALEQRGHRVTLVDPDASGRVSVDAIARALEPRTALVTMMAANNETGVLQPVEDLAALLHGRGIPLHVDAVQALGKEPCAPPPAGVTSLSVSAHKLGGPPGCGALWLRAGTRLRPLLVGGNQERGLRGGTHNLIGVVGFGAAAAAARERGSWSARARDRFEREVARELDGIVIHGAEAPRLPNTSNLRLPGLAGARLLQALGRAGVCVAQGSACQAGSAEPSHVLRAMGLSLVEVRASLRFSFGPGTDEATAVEGARRLVEVVRRLRSEDDAA